MKKISIIVSIVIVGFTSCQKILLPPISNNTPTKNFDEMWRGYDAWYGTFEARHINWDSLYNVYHPQVNDNMSNTELYNVLAALITPLDDIHAFLQPTSDGLPRYESNEFFRIHKVQQDFSIDVIKQNYLPALTTIDNTLHYGLLNGNIGYIHFGAFDMSVKFYEQQMNSIMTALKNTKGIIVDIRNHGGGDNIVSRYIAGLFAQERKLFMTVKKRNGSACNDFGKTEYWYVDKQGSYQYTKPVMLLITRWTASAGETFAWAMDTQKHVKQMGDNTAGGFTDVISRELPNGWLYCVGVGDYRNADGEIKEGKGVAPETYIINTKEDIDAGKDKVLEAAIDKLK